MLQAQIQRKVRGAGECVPPYSAPLVLIRYRHLLRSPRPVTLGKHRKSSKKNAKWLAMMAASQFAPLSEKDRKQLVGDRAAPAPHLVRLSFLIHLIFTRDLLLWNPAPQKALETELAEIRSGRIQSMACSCTAVTPLPPGATVKSLLAKAVESKVRTSRPDLQVFSIPPSPPDPACQG